MYFCGATIAGPFYEFKDYKNFIERKDHYADVPSTIIPSIIRITTAFGNLFFYLVVLLALLVFLETFIDKNFPLSVEFSSEPAYIKVFLNIYPISVFML